MASPSCNLRNIPRFANFRMEQHVRRRDERPILPVESECLCFQGTGVKDFSGASFFRDRNRYLVAMECPAAVVYLENPFCDFCSAGDCVAISGLYQSCPE